jgi:hypothetical protein
MLAVPNERDPSNHCNRLQLLHRFLLRIGQCGDSVLLAIALIVILRHIRRIRYAPFRDLENRSEMPPVAVLIPARNERNVIIRTIESVRGLLYPWTEIVVVNDGSTDDTLQLLIKHYNLRRIDPLYRDIIKTRPVRGFYYTSDIPNLIVVDKEKRGQIGCPQLRHQCLQKPYICTLDADSIFEPNPHPAGYPSVQSTVPVIASGGVVRVLNGVKRENGVMKQIELPRKSSLAIFQIVEYLRASSSAGRPGCAELQPDPIGSLFPVSEGSRHHGGRFQTGKRDGGHGTCVCACTSITASRAIPM